MAQIADDIIWFRYAKIQKSKSIRWHVKNSICLSRRVREFALFWWGMTRLYIIFFRRLLVKQWQRIINNSPFYVALTQPFTLMCWFQEHLLRELARLGRLIDPWFFTWVYSRYSYFLQCCIMVKLFDSLTNAETYKQMHDIVYQLNYFLPEIFFSRYCQQYRAQRQIVHVVWNKVSYRNVRCSLATFTVATAKKHISNSIAAN